MNVLQKELDKVIMNAPYQVFTDLIESKLSGQGITLSARQRQELADRLKSDTIDPLFFKKWHWSNIKDLKITVTDEEIETIQERFTEFLRNQLPDLISSTAEDLSITISETLNRRWPKQLRRDNRILHGFQKRLLRRWGHGIDLLRMLLVIAREFGDNVTGALRSSQNLSLSTLVDVISRLHARACQVTDEIICLLCAGLADGAMARWRTLHEIAAVAFLLKQRGEDLAIRYFDHQDIENYRAACEYQACYEHLGYEPLSTSELAEVKKAYENAISQYGSSFKTQYGWAAFALNKENPTFKDIEHASGIGHLRAHYKMASHNVHANPKGVFFKLGLVEEEDILLAGPSNAGLTDPGHCAAISLMQVTTVLGIIEPNLDSLVCLRIIQRLVDEIGEAFAEASQKLEEDINSAPLPSEESLKVTES